MSITVDYNASIQGVQQDESLDSILRIAFTGVSVDVCTLSTVVFTTIDSEVTIDAKALGIKALTFIAYSSNYPIDIATKKIADDDFGGQYSGTYSHSLIKFFKSPDDNTYIHSSLDYIKLKAMPGLTLGTATVKLYVGGLTSLVSSSYNLD